MANDKLEFSTKLQTDELIKELEHAQQLLEKFGEDSKEAGEELNQSLKKVIDSLQEVGKEGEQAGKSTKNSFNGVSNSFKSVGKVAVDVAKQVGELSKKIYEVGNQTLDKLKTGFLAVGGAITGVIASSVKVGAEFENTMTQVGVLSGLALEGTEEATNQLKQLEATAKEIGRTTQFSAVQAGEGFKMMAMAGYSTEDMLNALPQAMGLAGATGEDFTLIVERMTNNLNAFGMSTKDAGRFADVVATATTKVTTNVSELTEAFLEAGTISNAFGINVEDTSVVLGILADNGIKASKSGTTYKNMLLGLNAPTDKARELMDKYNLSVKNNVDGSMDLIGTLKDMRGKLKDVDNETKANILTTIVGREAYAGLNVLLNTSAERFDELSDAIYNSSGNALKMSELMLDSLEGQLTILKSSFEGLQLAIFDNIAPITKEGVKFINESLNEVTQAIEEGRIQDVPIILGNVLSEGLLKIGEALPNLIEIVSSSIDSFFQALLQDSSRLAEAGQGIVTSLLNGIREQLPNLYNIIKTLAPTIADLFLNWFPMIFEIGVTVITALVDGIGSNPDQLISTITTVITNLIDTITSNLPTFLEQGLNIIFAIIEGIAQNLPAIIDALILVIDQLINTIVNNLPEFVQKGMELIISVMQGIGEKSGVLVAKIIELIGVVIKTLLENLPQFIKSGGEFILGLIKGIVSEIPNILSLVGELAISLIKAIGDGFKQIFSVGKDLVLQLWEGIKSIWSSLTGWVGDLAKGLINSVKGIFGIHSPSRVFAEIGENLDQGLIEGLENNKDEVIKTSSDIAKEVVNVTNEELEKINSPSLDLDKLSQDLNDFKSGSSGGSGSNKGSSSNKGSGSSGSSGGSREEIDKEYLNTKKELLEEATKIEEDYITKLVEIREKEKAIIKELNAEYRKQLEFLRNIYGDKTLSDIETSINEDLQELNKISLEEELAKLEQEINAHEQNAEKKEELQKEYVSVKNEILKEAINIELQYLKKITEIRTKEKEELKSINAEYKKQAQYLQQIYLTKFLDGQDIKENSPDTIKAIQNLINNVVDTINKEKEKLETEEKTQLDKEIERLEQELEKHEENTKEKSELEKEYLSLKTQLIEESSQIEAQYLNKIVNIRKKEYEQLNLINEEYRKQLDYLKGIYLLKIAEATGIDAQNYQEVLQQLQGLIKDFVVDANKELNNITPSFDFDGLKNEIKEELINYKDTTNQKEEIDKEYLQNKEQLFKEVNKLELEYLTKIAEIRQKEKELIQNVNKEYQKQLDLIKEIYNTNLNYEKDFLNEDLNNLFNKGVNSSLLSELDSLGHEAKEQIQILSTMTETELKEFEIMWLTQFQNINNTTGEQLELLAQQNQEKLNMIKEQTKIQLEEEKIIFIEKLQDLVNSSIEVLDTLPILTPEIGTLAIQNLEQAIIQAKPSLQATLTNIVNELVSQARASLSSALSSMQAEAQSYINSFSSMASQSAYSFGGSFGRSGVNTRAIENTTNYINNKNNSITQNITFSGKIKSPYETAKEIKRNTKDLL